MGKPKQTYKYIKDRSIIYGETDEYVLSQKEYYQLYNFFVTYSLCNGQSSKQRTIKDYGWNEFSRKINDKNNNPVVYLKDSLLSIIDLDNKNSFIFTGDDNLSDCFMKLKLCDGKLNDMTKQRAVIGRTKGDNRFLQLLYRIRDGFAHGNFALKYNELNEKVILIQDNDKNNVTARIVLKLKTLLDIINIVDRNGLIIQRKTKVEVA